MNGLSAIPDISPPALLADFVDRFAAKPAVQRDLARLGAQAADRTFDAIFQEFARRVFRPASAPSPGDPWVEKIASPILGPFAEGFGARLKDRARPVLAALGAGVAGVLLIAYLIGRRAGRRSMRRSEAT